MAEGFGTSKRGLTLPYTGPNRPQDATADTRFGEATLAEGRVTMFGNIPFGSDKVPFVWPTARAPQGNGTYKLFGKPKLDMRALRPPKFGERLYFNPVLLVNSDMAAAPVRQYEIEHGSAVLSAMNNEFAAWKNWENGDRHQQAAIYAQFARVFLDMFGLSFYELQRIQLSDVYALYSDMMMEGPHIACKMHTFHNMRYKTNVRQQQDTAATAVEPIQDLGIPDPDAESDTRGDAGLRKPFVKVRMSLDRAVKLYFRQGGLDGDDKDSDDDGGGDDDESDGDGDDDAETRARAAEGYASLFQTAREHQQAQAPASRKRRREPINIYDLTGLPIVSTDWRKVRLPTPDFSNTTDAEWLRMLVYDRVCRMYSEEGYHCVENEYFRSLVIDMTSERFPAKVTMESIWEAVIAYVADSEFVIYDMAERKVVDPVPLGADGPATLMRTESLRVALRSVFAHERFVAESFGHYQLRGAMQIDMAQTMKAVLETTEVAFAEKSPFGKLTLAPEQWQALVHVLATPVTIMHGPGGTGKSMMMQVMTEALRIQGFLGPFLYTAFKHDSVNQTTDYIRGMTKDKGYVSGNFQDASYLLLTANYVGVRFQAELLKAEVVFLEEASMLSTSHFYHLLRALDRGTLKRIIIIGDGAQLPAILPGEPLLNLISAMPGAAVRLKKGFRANTETLTENMNRIRIGEVTTVEFDDPTKAAEGSFFLYSKDLERCDGKRRSLPWVMTAHAEMLQWILETRDPDKTRYDDIWAITQFNDIARYASYIINRYYFGDDTPDSMAQKYAISDESARGYKPPLYLDSRAAILVSDPAKGWARGYIGKIKGIVDHDDYHFAIPNTPALLRSIKHTNVPCTRAYRSVIMANNAVLTVGRGKSFMSVLEPASAATVHRVQGLGIKEVICLMMSGVNLQSRRMLYTAISRSIDKCHVIAAGDQLRRMIDTLDPAPLSTLPAQLEAQLHPRATKAFSDLVSTILDFLCPVIHPTDNAFADDDYDIHVRERMDAHRADRTRPVDLGRWACTEVTRDDVG